MRTRNIGKAYPLLLALLVIVVFSLPAVAAPSTDTSQVFASGETGSVDDDADDAAIWIHPADPAQSLVIGTDKHTGVFTWDLAGNEVQFLQRGDTNNIDVRYNFPLDNDLVDIVATGNESTNRIEVYRVVPSTRRLQNIAGPGIRSNLDETYGICLYHSSFTGKFYAFVNDKDGDVEQWELFDHNGKVNGALVRTFNVGSQTEGCVADDERGDFYIGEEEEAIWKYGAEPDAGDARIKIDDTDGHFTADVEGLTLYYGPDGSGYLIASSQGSDEFVVYDRRPPHDYIMTFEIVGDNGIDDVSNPDGIDVTNVALGGRYSEGLFVTQDGHNDSGNNNFKLVRWDDIADSVSPSLIIDTMSYDPRSGSPSPSPTATDVPDATPTRTPEITPTLTPTQESTPDFSGVQSGIWISREDLQQLPTSGPAWNQLREVADQNAGTPDLSDQDDDTNIAILAKALVYARIGAERYRNDVVDALRTITFENTENRGRTLALGRELAAYIISADLIDLANHDPTLDSQFRDKLRELLTKTLDGKTLQSTHEERPNNWGTMAGGSRAAIAVYLGDTTELERIAQVFKGWLGDRGAYAGFSYGDLSWQCDPDRPVGVNPQGCVKGGHSIDGVLPDDQRRGGGFRWPPPKENYVWEGLQGALVQAEILNRAGYPAWEWEDRALLRAVAWLHDQAGFPAEGDDEWEPWLINYRYGTDFSAANPASPGKNMGWTDWTHSVAPAPDPTDPSPSVTATKVPDPTDTPEPTDTPAPTDTPTLDPTATTVPDPTDTPTPGPTDTPAPTDTPTPDPTTTTVPGPTDTPEPTDTPVPTDTPTPDPTTATVPDPTDTPTPDPTDTPAPTDTPTPEPTVTTAPDPTDTPTPEPTDTLTPVPTETPTPQPTETPATPPPTEDFDPRQIPIELQAWWIPNYGHIHAAAKLPLGQQVSGMLDFQVRIVLHDNPSHLYELRTDTDRGVFKRIRLDLDCPYDGNTSSTCAFSIPVSLDTTQMHDGWRELRIRATVETPDGKKFLNSSGIPINVQNGGRDRDYNRFCNNTSLIGRGWYRGAGYTNAIIECVPLEPVSGVHTFRVRAQKPSAHLTVALDKTHFIPATGSWSEVPPSTGRILFDEDGDFQDWVPITVDTTTLENGWHSLSVTSTGPEGDTSSCSYCDGEINKPAGVAKMWFFVQN